ncbi:hypothetical protein [Arthrobacter sp. ES3-54]|uniref:hypothetical protein n=1 Tax=Arthrobacter sp. ES3-54 TaxID=1502991 RepID=UPI0024054D82|nr:hypothetical protein [Arthrobacter sp. ES3-54]MDF9750961.1 hypothetical protein [Arthrobacter sp. ES3-54]
MKRLTVRRFIPTALLAAALLAASPAAIAAPPEKGGNPPDFPPGTVVDAGLGCVFPLLIEATNSNATIKTFKDKTGAVARVITAGRGYTLTYTRLDANGNRVKSLNLRPTGSVQKVAVAADGTQTITATGTNGLVLFPNDLPLGAGPSAVQYQGRIVYTISPSGVFTLLSTSGTRTDICAAVA